jgi:hypothetical protein
VIPDALYCPAPAIGIVGVPRSPSSMKTKTAEGLPFSGGLQSTATVRDSPGGGCLPPLLGDNTAGFIASRVRSVLLKRAVALTKQNRHV